MVNKKRTENLGNKDVDESREKSPQVHFILMHIFIYALVIAYHHGSCLVVNLLRFYNFIVVVPLWYQSS